VLRPITLYPFPSLQFQKLADRARVFVVVEMSNGQMLEDVRLALNGARPVEFLSRMGGNVPSHGEVLAFVREAGAADAPGARSRKGRGWAMSNGTEAEYEVAHGRPQAFYENFERKASCSTRRIIARAAGMASCTRCWLWPSMSSAFRTGRS
jgi:hypothetical protein